MFRSGSSVGQVSSQGTWCLSRAGIRFAPVWWVHVCILKHIFMFIGGFGVSIIIMFFDRFVFQKNSFVHWRVHVSNKYSVLWWVCVSIILTALRFLWMAVFCSELSWSTLQDLLALCTQQMEFFLGWSMYLNCMKHVSYRRSPNVSGMWHIVRSPVSQASLLLFSVWWAVSSTYYRKCICCIGGKSLLTSFFSVRFQNAFLNKTLCKNLWEIN
jgi:hypothetical protein